MSLPNLYLLLAITPYLIILSWFDWKRRILPNVLTVGGALVILVWRFGWGGAPCLLNGLIAGLIGGLFLLIPFFLRAAGGGDVKFLFTAGLMVGMPAVFTMLMLTSIAGLIIGVSMQLAGLVDSTRLKHVFRCVFDWRYDRKAGKVNLLSADNERARIPFGLAIACGVWLTLLLRVGRWWL